MSDDGPAADAGARPVLCSRCVRAPRDPVDRTTWITLSDERICPGCLTQSDRERLRTDPER
jgi:hypothetical protein